MFPDFESLIQLTPIPVIHKEPKLTLIKNL